MGKILHVTAAAHCYPGGQMLDRVLVEYDCPLDAVSRDAFEVSGRTITDAQASGQTVTLILSLQDKLAPVLEEPNMPPRKPGAAPVGGPPVDLPPVVRRPVQVLVRQIAPIRDAAGNTVLPDGLLHRSDRTSEPVVEEFIQGLFRNISYNLYVPKTLAPGRTYPLALFIHDAGPCGPDPKLTLSQGLGAVGFASPAWQEKHPCFVLAPQIGRGIRMTTDDFTCSKELETIKALLDSVLDRCPIDRSRIYTTGQSMGCMASCELNIRYPDLFAASLLAAGQWDPEKMGAACNQKKLWILVSEHDAKAFPGMNAVTEALERRGARVARHSWDGAADPEALSRLALEAMEDEANVHYTVFRGSTVVPPGQPDHPGSNHVNTWRVVYTIDGLKEWLFSWHKEA